MQAQRFQEVLPLGRLHLTPHQDVPDGGLPRELCASCLEQPLHELEVLAAKAEHEHVQTRLRLVVDVGTAFTQKPSHQSSFSTVRSQMQGLEAARVCLGNAGPTFLEQPSNHLGDGVMV